MTFNPWSKNRYPAPTKQVREKRKLLLATELWRNIRRKGGNGKSPLRNKTGKNQLLVKTGIVNMILRVTKQDSNHKGEHSKSTAEEADSLLYHMARLPGKEACGIVCSPVCCVEKDTSPLSRGHGTNFTDSTLQKCRDYQRTEELGGLKGTKATWWLSAMGVLD